MEVKEFSSIKLPNDVYPFEIKDARFFENEKGKAWRIDGEIRMVPKSLAFTFFVPFDITQKNRHGLLLKALLGRELTTGEHFEDDEHGFLMRGKSVRLVLEWDGAKERMAVKSILPFKEGTQTIGEAKQSYPLG